MCAMDDRPVFEGKPPHGWWKQFWVANHLGAWFRRHLTSLQVVIGHEGKPYTGVYTGFLLERRGALFWVTAAHCLDDIEQHRLNPALAACWVDNHKDDAARSIPVVDAASMLDGGLKAPARDVGVLQPSKHEARLFRANPDYHPLDDVAWQGKGSITPDGLYVLGYPDEWRTDLQTETAETYDLMFTAALASLPMVERLSPDYGSGDFWGRTNCIYGRVALPDGSPGPALKKIDGMSGGPVLSVQWVPGKGVVYHLFGVQSSWLPDSRIVRAEPIEAVVELIDQADARG